MAVSREPLSLVEIGLHSEAVRTIAEITPDLVADKAVARVQRANSIEVEGVSKSFGRVPAVDDVSFRLRRGERSSVFRITSSRRTPVASWYLRLREPAGRDPLWGLVRVEAADPDHTGEPLEALTRRADLLSRWVLAEVAPLALPDGRWDKMVYGIRDCEEFLRAVC